MIENIAHGRYAEVVDSYTSLNISSNIRGELLEKNGKNLRLDIGNNEALDIELREDIDIKKGETVLIDRRNIVKSKVVKLDDEIKIDKTDTDVYTYMLKRLDIEVNDENIKILKRFDSYEIDITKENFETYVLAKNSLRDISSSLDYETAIRLTEMDIDIENISIEKLSSIVENLEEEKEGFKILNMFKKSELTTEEAEQIAKDLYGSKMGKDITDIIKSLHKRKVNITKKNIEKINNVFYKLDKLNDIEDKTFVDTIKNKLDINIENLYKVKRYVKDESVEVKQANDLNKIINIKNYNSPDKNMTRVTEKELRLLEEDIRDLIVDLDIELTEDKVNLSKEFIKRDMSITKESIETIEEMKVALDYIIKNLNKEIASELVKENIDIETTDLRVIADKIGIIKNSDLSTVEMELVKSDVSKVEDLELKALKKDVEMVIEEIENKDYNRDNNTIKQNIVPSKEQADREQIVVDDKALPINIDETNKDTGSTLENHLVTETENVIEAESVSKTQVLNIETKPNKTNENIDNRVIDDSKDTSPSDILNKVETLKKIEQKDILTLLERNIDFKISKIEDTIFNKVRKVPIGKIEDATYNVPSTQAGRDNAFKPLLDKVNTISTAFKDIGRLDINTIAFQIKKNIPINIQSIQKSNKSITPNIDNIGIDNLDTITREISSLDVTNALSRNGLENTRINIQRTMQAFRSYENIKENLTSNMLKQSIRDNIEFEKMDINLASKYIDEYKNLNKGFEISRQNEESISPEVYAKTLAQNTQNIVKNMDNNIMFLMKNNKPLSFKQLNDTNAMFDNKEQLGHKISDLLDMADKDGNDLVKEKVNLLKRDIMEISKNINGSKEDLEKSYKKINDAIREIEESLLLSNQEHNENLNRKSREVSQKIDENRELARENKIIQMPFYMNGQFTNLNMYFRDKEREGRNKDSDETSVVLSIDTVNMGNVNVNLDIRKKDIDIKVGLENLEDKTYIEGFKPLLKEFLEQDGYEVGEIEFFKEGEKDSFLREDKIKEQPKILNGNLDIKI